MKKISALLVCFVISSCAWSQAVQSKSDRIYKKDNSVVDCKIMEVTGGEIKYKKANYLDGPTYSLAKSEVATIQYANGDSEVINTGTPASVQQPQRSSEPVSDNSPEPEDKGSSDKFYEYVGDVYFKGGGVYIGGDYDFFWRLDDDTKNSNMYLGFGLQGYYGFGTTGSYGNTGVASNGPIDISGGTLSSSVIYVPAQFRIFPSNSNFFVEAQLGPSVNFWRWSGTNNAGYQSDSGVKLTVAPGINVGYLSRSGFGITARWNSALGVGLGLNISYLSRNK